ncbi:MAG: hypothetical protein ACOZEN_08975 [Thermodesulfobacteriota bacterium]
MPMLANPLVSILLALALFGGGWWAGFSRADSARVAEVATIRAEHAAAYAEAERQARERLEAETAKVNDLAARLHEEKGRIVVQTKVITRRIKDAARSAAGCSFGPDFVRLFNEALGYPGGGAVSESAGAAGADGDTAAATASGPGLLPGKPVTPADILAFARDYGAWARSLEAQTRALAAFVQVGR